MDKNEGHNLELTIRNQSLLLKKLTAVLVSVLALAIITTPVVSGLDVRDTEWWVGKGASQNTYLKYQIREFNTNDGRPFNMTIYFKQQDNSSTWIAPTWIEDNGTAINGTLLLGNDLAIMNPNSPDIPNGMKPYLLGYDNSLRWISAFLPQTNPRTFASLTEGKYACIGGLCGPPMSYIGSENLTVPTGNFSTLVLVNHYGQTDSKIWIKPDFPFPIKGLFYLPSYTAVPVIAFSFVLIEVGTGKPVAIPEFQNGSTLLLLGIVAATAVVRLRWLPI